MSGTIRSAQVGHLSVVTIDHPARFNAMSRAMWAQLKTVFEQIQHNADVRCVVIKGEGAHFCAGGDISEYADFRFQEESLRHFHENEVWGGLQAMLDCDVPIVAQIEGNCMGAGVEIASCCDIRLSSSTAQFGAPIAKLGFPMAPREAALVTRELGATVARQMLLAATLFSPSELLACGFLSQVVAGEQLNAQAQALAERVVSLAPQAARLNKQTIRVPNQPLALVLPAGEAIDLVVNQTPNPYAYADSAEHREGVMAFLQKRKPVF
ncbi:enoyl-CoA hydratase/isomerase family protein [Rhodoferax sp. PAMC 29310]|uniref:enoyl-CoA hydratase/isomerase family protein n=1 Tax=Rhodoferax sp. PAMC 29310 TaxID=2822760 RepID=UPI001B344E86|nr:enoyl-CoA hydratase/isomerase family protein [Rhodoferax sp. PAMC 29310]